ncbi:MAG: hypothetical protein R3D71_09510 [Rickettsiales bacterium]
MNDNAEPRKWAEGLPDKAKEIQQAGIGALGDNVSNEAKGAIQTQATVIAIAIPQDRDRIEKIFDTLKEQGGLSDRQAEAVFQAMVNKKVEIDGRSQGRGK